MSSFHDDDDDDGRVTLKHQPTNSLTRSLAMYIQEYKIIINYCGDEEVLVALLLLLLLGCRMLLLYAIRASIRGGFGLASLISSSSSSS